MIGFYSGLEYSADILKSDYDMARDFQPVKRAFVVCAALAAGVQPVVETSVPLVQGVLLRHPSSGRSAVTLVNWAYRAQGTGQTVLQPSGRYALVPFNSVRVVVRGAGPVRAIRSAWSGAKLEFQQRWDDIELTLPRIDEADVLLLE